MNASDLTKMILAVAVVLGSIAVTLLYVMGKVSVTTEGGAVMGYLLGEARTILTSYFTKDAP